MSERRVALLANDLATPGGVPKIVEVARDALSYGGWSSDTVYFGLSKGPAWSARRRRLDLPQPSEDERGIALFCPLPETQFLPALLSSRQLKRLRAKREWSMCLVLGGAAYHGFAAHQLGLATAVWIGTTISSERASRLLPRALSRVVDRVALPALTALEQRTLHSADLVMSQSAFTSREVERDYGVDPILLRPPLLRRRHTRSAPRPGEMTTIFIGRTSDPRKRFHVALSAMREAAFSQPLVRFEFRYTGSESFAASGIKPGNLTVLPLGRPGDDELAQHLAESDLLLLPSSQEGFGLVVQEALSVGTPVICTPCGGPEDMITESGAGEVCPVHEFWKPIARLAGDYELRSTWVQRAQEWASAQAGEHEFSQRLTTLLEDSLRPPR